ncbi:MAG: hypothetical protein HQL72_12620 [Magnetococcales bacterium]|nr:hypothetical protein [Magnetococcales bacterium]
MIPRRQRIALLLLFALLVTGDLTGAAEGETAPVFTTQKGVTSLTNQVYRDIRQGKLNIQGDHSAVEVLILQREIPITYDYISIMMRTPNAFGEGPACIVCHSSNNPEHSYRGLDLSTCEGILRGSTEDPPRPIILPGNPEKSPLVRRLHSNRMPLGIPFFHPNDGPSIQMVKQWINDGAKNDEHFNKSVLPLFSDKEAFGGDFPCSECHPSTNGLSLTSYRNIMRGAFYKSRKREGLPILPVVIPGNAEESPLYQRLTTNRMPPGISPGEDINHPNIQILTRWVKQGAWCK